LTPIYSNKDTKPHKYNIIFPLKEIFFEDIKVYVPNQLQTYCIDAWKSFPPPLPPINKRFPHEGRIQFIIPEWLQQKYKHLYKKV